MSAVDTGFQTAQYFTVGAMALLVFDYCLTISQEVQLIWGKRWNVLRVTFTLARYVTFIGAAMTTFAAVVDRSKYKSCNTFNSISNVSHLISIVAAEVLLIIRTYAFWLKSKKVLVWLIILAVSCIAGTIAVNNLPFSALGGGTTGCEFDSGKTSAIQYGFIIFFELVLMILTVYKRFSFYQGSSGRFVTTLYRDGLIYMTCIIMTSVANIFVFLFAPVAYTDMMNVPQLVIHGVLASRILLNLRASNESESAVRRRLVTPLSSISTKITGPKIHASI